MKRRISALLLSLCMVVTLLPTTVFAAEPYTPTVNNTAIYANPTADITTAAKSMEKPASVSFELTNIPAYANNLTWTVYSAATGDTLADGVTASNIGNSLTLSHITDLSAGDYYVSVTYEDKTESARLKLTVKEPLWTDGRTADESYGFGGGTGTQENPYLISSAIHLAMLAVNVNSKISHYCGKYFKLTADIDLAGKYWVPIGFINKPEKSFRGNFNGDNHVISNMNIKYSLCGNAANAVGLFGWIYGGTNSGSNGAGASVKKLGLINASVIIDSNISNIAYCKGSAGMLAGYADRGIAFENCYAIGTISATGIVSCIGGLVGYSANGSNTLKNCFFRGTIAAASGDEVGGIIGGSGSVIPTDCYVAASIISSATNKYAVASSATDCYYDSTILGITPTGGQATAKNTYEMKTAAMAKALGSAWGYEESKNDGYPYLITTVSGSTNWYNSTKTVQTISTAEDLMGLAQLVNAGNTFVDKIILLNADIDLTEKDWIPIGTPSAKFEGMFSGQGHTVSNMTIQATANNQGFFGVTNGANIQNFSLTDIYISAGGDSSNIGGLVGLTYSTLVRNCTVEGEIVTNSCTCVGGLIGNANSAVVQRILADVNVNVDNPNVKINIGGLIGNIYSGVNLTDCAVLGTVTTTGLRSGGIAGYLYGTGTWTNVYFAGQVSGQNNVGAFYGYATNVPTLNNCYYLDTCGTANGIEGKDNTAATSATAEIMASENFASTLGSNWAQSNSLYNGYPYSVNTFSVIPVEPDGISGSWADIAVTDWFDENKTVQTVSTAQELAGLAKLVNEGNTFIDKIILLDATINLAGKYWTPIGTDAKQFKGVFDGQGHSVSNMTVQATANNQGFFGVTNGANIQNFSLTDIYISAGGDISNIGGLIGYSDNTLVRDCSMQGNIVSNGGENLGGLIGYANNTTYIERCLTDVNIVSGAEVRAGGFVGNNDENLIMTDCACVAEISVPGNKVGGIAGHNYFGNTLWTNVYFAGQLDTNAKVMFLGNAPILTNCWYLGTCGSTAGVTGMGETAAQPKTETEMKSAEFLTLLGAAWAQNDTKYNGYPYPISAVYGATPAEPEGVSGNWADCAVTDWYDETKLIQTVSTAQDLAGLAQLVDAGNAFVDKIILLDANINLAGKYWTPIGTDAKQFKGVFDGQGHTVSGITITATGNNQGFFGRTNGANIQRLKLSDAYISSGSGKSNIGALIGYSSTTLVRDCTAQGSIVTNCSVMLGGLIGYCSGDTRLVRCLADVDITAYYTGSSAGTTDISAAGIIGYNFDHLSLTDCACLGDIYLTGNKAGGILGHNYFGGTTWMNVYFAGHVSATNNSNAFFVSGGLPILTNCWYLDTCGSTAGVTGANNTAAQPKTEAEMKSAEFLTLLDADWTQNDTKYNGYPYPISAVYGATPAEPEGVSGNWADCAVTDWYDETKLIQTVSTAQDIAGLAQLVNAGNAFIDKIILLDANINLAGKYWTPIGTDTKQFKGVFDGQGHTVSGITITATSNNQGFFGSTNGATVQMLRITDAYISAGSGKSNIGALIGYSSTTLVRDCTVQGSIVTNCSVMLGGLIGRCSGDTRLVRCLADVDITAYYTGSSAGTTDISAAGIIGYNFDHLSLTDCACLGDIYLTGNKAGGILGHNYFGGTTWMNVYFAGHVSATNNSNAFFVSGSLPILTNCWYLDTCGSTAGVTGANNTAVQPKTENEMKSAEFLSLLGDAWAQDNVKYNGYPYTIHFHSGGTATCTEQAICDICRKPYGELGAHTYGTLISEVPATHTSTGVEAHYICSVCGKYFTEEKVETELEELNIPVIPHSYGTQWEKDATNHWKKCSCGNISALAEHSFGWITDTEVTEDNTGIKHEECSVCSYKRNENTVIDKLPHTHAWVETPATASTCLTQGNNQYFYCSKCEKFYTADKVTETTVTAEKLPLADHNYGTLISEVPATHTSTGVEAHYICSVCGKYFTEEKVETELEELNIPVIPHSYGTQWEKDATNHWKKCSCGNISALAEHSFGWITDTEATEDNTGIKHEECSVCSYKRNENTVIDKLPHTHAWVETPATASTCLVQGNNQYFYCSKCEKFYTADKVTETTVTAEKLPLADHNYGTLISEVPATHTSTGVEAHYICSVCGKYFTEEKVETELEELNIPVIPHSYGTQWEKDATNHWKKCGCGNISALTKHTFGSWTVTTPPTTKAAGVKTSTCTVCGATKTEAVPKLPITFTNSSVAKLDSNKNIVIIAETSAADLLKQAPGATLFDLNGKPLAVNKKPGSGMTLQLSDSTKHSIIIYGDADSDGSITSADARIALRRAVGLEPIVAWRDIVCNVDKKQSCSAADARLILRAAVGLEDNKKWF